MIIVSLMLCLSPMSVSEQMPSTNYGKRSTALKLEKAKLEIAGLGRRLDTATKDLGQCIRKWGQTKRDLAGALESVKEYGAYFGGDITRGISRGRVVRIVLVVGAVALAVGVAGGVGLAVAVR